MKKFKHFLFETSQHAVGNIDKQMEIITKAETPDAQLLKKIIEEGIPTQRINMFVNKYNIGGKDDFDDTVKRKFPDVTFALFFLQRHIENGFYKVDWDKITEFITFKWNKSETFYRAEKLSSEDLRILSKDGKLEIKKKTYQEDDDIDKYKSWSYRKDILSNLHGMDSDRYSNNAILKTNSVPIFNVYQFIKEIQKYDKKWFKNSGKGFSFLYSWAEDEQEVILKAHKYIDKKDVDHVTRWSSKDTQTIDDVQKDFVIEIPHKQYDGEKYKWTVTSNNIQQLKDSFEKYKGLDMTADGNKVVITTKKDNSILLRTAGINQKKLIPAPKELVDATGIKTPFWIGHWA